MRRLTPSLLAVISLAALLAAGPVLVACSSTATPTSAPGSGTPVAGSPGANGGPGVTAGPGTTATPGGPGTPGSAGTTASHKVQAAVASGALDYATGILYRIYAHVGDPRLPGAYRGDWTDDGAAITLAAQEFADLPAATQDAIRPFISRPTSPDSYWAAGATAANGNMALAAYRPGTAATPQTAALCEHGFLREPVPGIPVVVVWGQCGGQDESGVLRQVGEVVSYMGALWGPMTELMGDPIGDAFDPAFPGSGTPEAGDGNIDIYVVDRSVSVQGRNTQVLGLATAIGTAPRVGDHRSAASSGYIVIDGTQPAGPILKSTLAHEFFHVLGYAHNASGTWAPVPGGGAGGPWERFWFVEASAVWAEHQFVPEARATEVHPRFEVFQESDLSLADTTDSNEYNSWIWPMFMAQEYGPESVAGAWYGFEGLVGYDALMGALDGELDFSGYFRDFAVRAYNDDLTPGDAIDPRFQDHDPNLPRDIPSGSETRYGNDLAPGSVEPYGENLPALTASYTELNVDAGVGQVQFDFSELTSDDAADVDLLLKIRDKEWERRDGTDSAPICDVEQVIVVVSNHGIDRTKTLTRKWTAEGIEEECTGGTWLANLSGGETGAGTYSGKGEVSCVHYDWGWSIGVTTESEDLRLMGFGSNAGNGRTWDYISVTTRFAYDTPIDWFARDDDPNTTITVIVNEAADRITAALDGTWKRGDVVWAAHLEAICSRVADARTGQGPGG